jgi:hypothetical protein
MSEGHNVMRRAMHMLDAEDYVEAAINNWMRVMEVSRLEAARQVVEDAENTKGLDPDVIEAAHKALRRAQRS